jgi:hypothetical protein
VRSVSEATLQKPYFSQQAVLFTLEPDKNVEKPSCILFLSATGLRNRIPDLMKIGYARVSTLDQATAAQVEKLKAAGCGKIYKEKESGGRWDRPQLQAMRDHLRAGDTVVITKLDRLSRSLKGPTVSPRRLRQRGGHL